MTFDAQLRSALQAIHATPTASEAAAIIDVARLAAAADNRTDLSETVVLLALTRIVCEMAGMAQLPDMNKPLDPKRLGEIGESLVPTGVRELAYACAFMVMVQDLDVTKEETHMAAALGDALMLDTERAKALATQMETLVRSARK